MSPGHVTGLRSLLMSSALQRLAAALLLVGALWLGVWWALEGGA